MEKDKIIALLAILAVVSVALNLYQYIAYQNGKVELSYSQSGATGRGKTSTAGQAPLGTYVGTTGSTAFITGVQVNGDTLIVVPKTTKSPTYYTVAMTIDTYSPPEELEAIANAGSGNYVSVMSGFNHGTVTVAGTTYPLNVATSVTVGSNYLISLVSGVPISVPTEGGSKTVGNAVGLIQLQVPTAGGTGRGILFTGTGVTVTLTQEGGGTVTVKGGVGTATELTNVQKY